MGEIMNYSLLNEFEKYIYRNFDKCISPVLPPFCVQNIIMGMKV